MGTYIIKEAYERIKRMTRERDEQLRQQKLRRKLGRPLTDEERKEGGHD